MCIFIFLDYYVYNYPDDHTIYTNDKDDNASDEMLNTVVLKSVTGDKLKRREEKVLKRESKKIAKNTDAPVATPREQKIGGPILRMAEAVFTTNEQLFDNENQYLKYEGT